MTRLKYFTVEKTDRNINDVLSKMRRELGATRLYSYAPLINLGGNTKILELRHDLSNNLLIKIDGPEFLLKELKEYFTNGGNI